MKTHLFEGCRQKHPMSRQTCDDILFGAVFLVGIPILVVGIRYVIDKIFYFFI